MHKTGTDTAQKILATAEALIYQNGIHATGMDLLVKTSGVARKSIYRHFENKDQVAATALNARDVRWLAWFQQAAGSSPTAIAAAPSSIPRARWATPTIRFATSQNTTSRSCWITRWNSPRSWISSSRTHWRGSCWFSWKAPSPSRA
ncbi:hypothetical protein G6F22_016699 [Rhizopus arrhizus]|nr:hypothetical protein G6F22_016699 [Rhizopus arrhizus]